MKKRNKVTTLLGGMTLCLLLGLSAAPKARASDVTLVMGNPSWTSSSQFQLKDLQINSTDTIKTVIVSMTDGSLLNPTLSSNMTVNTNLTKDMYTFTYSSKQAPSVVENFLKTLKFNYKNGQQINIRLDANETNIPSGATITNGSNGHYYMYVPYPAGYDSVTNKAEMDWIKAYNDAKGYSYLGMKGYLATITSQTEDLLLKKISNQGAWSGGMRVLTKSDQKVNDPNFITENMLALTTMPVSQETAKSSFYWTCGPEAGQYISQNYTNWNSGEPNSVRISSENEYESYLQINFEAQQRWNDLCRTYTDGHVHGYFVEFGGYGNTDPGYSASNTGKPIASGSVKVESYNVTSSKQYPSSANITNLPSTIKLNEKLQFNVSPTSDWSLTKDNVSIKVNGKVLTANQYTYDKTTGQVIVDGQYINGKVEVSVNPTLKWYTTNNTNLDKYLKATSVTKDDLTVLKTLNNGWANLSTDAKNYVASNTGKTVDTITAKLDAMVTASQFASDNDADITTIQNINKLTPNTTQELRNKIQSVKTKYNALTAASKSYLNDLSVTLNDLTQAQDFCDKYKTVYNTKPVTKTTIDQLSDLETDYNKLNTAQKALAKDTYDQLKDKLIASDMLKDHDAIISKSPVIKLNDDAKKVITSIENALDAYEKLSANQKAQIAPAVKTDLDNKLSAAKWVDGISPVLSKDKVNAADIANINASIQSYNNLGDAIKAQIDKSVIDQLKNQATAARWSDTHKDVLSKDTVDNTDLKAIKNAINAYNGLFNAEKQFIDSTVIDGLNQKLSAAQWNSDNNAIITDKGPIKPEDAKAVQKALNEYNALKQGEKDCVNQDVVNDLKDKLAVIQLFDQHPILNKTMDDIDYEDLPALKEGMKAYDQLTDTQKALVDPATKEIIDATRNADKWFNDHDAIIKKDIVNKDDFPTITSAIDNYNQLDDHTKKLVDPNVIKELNAKKKAAQWSEKNTEIITKDIKDITAQDLDDLRTAMDAYNTLSDLEKSFIDTSVMENVLEAQKDAFVKKYLSDDEGIMYDQLNGYNYEQILSGETDWINMSQNEKDKINQEIQDKMGSTYEELIADAKVLQESANAFVDKYLTDQEGNVYKDSNSSNYIQILSGLDSWNQMTQEEKDAINGILTSQEGKTYEELIADAKALDESTNAFVDKYVTDQKGNIYKDSNSSNYGQILSGLDAWNQKNQDEKNAINDVLKANGGKTYEELIADANQLHESANSFINKYLTDQKGNIYKDSNGSNYGQILSGLDTWNQKSQDEKNAINNILKANGGKTYEELLANAKKLNESATGFVQKYLTGKDKKIYKSANKSNYAQILSGSDAWNKMTQNEKDAINAILIANGGKTYEELLKQANEIKESVKTGDENNMMSLYMLLLSSLVGGCFIIRKRKKV